MLELFLSWVLLGSLLWAGSLGVNIFAPFSLLCKFRRINSHSFRNLSHLWVLAIVTILYAYKFKAAVKNLLEIPRRNRWCWTGQSQWLWAVSTPRVMTFLERWTSDYLKCYTVGFRRGLQLRHRYGVNFPVKHESSVRLETISQGGKQALMLELLQRRTKWGRLIRRRELLGSKIEREKARLRLDSDVVFVRNREGLMGASAVLARAKGKSALV